jgi:hypothetical protein
MTDEKQQIERIDTEEKFWTMVEDFAESLARGRTTGKQLGQRLRNLAWDCEDGRWLKLIGGTPSESNWWMWREVLRRAAALEKDVAWDPVWFSDIPLDTRFARVSAKDQMKIAFYADEKALKRDILTETTPGRYLTKFHSDLFNEAAVRSWTDKHRELYAPIEFGVTSDADQIEEIYRNGPDSCMSHHVEDYGMHIHPVRAYGKGPGNYGHNAGVAYVRKNDDYKARAVVNTDAKEYVRMYGDSVLLERELRKAGYEHVSGLEGLVMARLVDHIGGQPALVLPYLDGSCDWVTDHGNHLVVSDTGDYESESCGYVYLEGGSTKCDCCGERYHADDMASAHCGESEVEICRGCLDEYYLCDEEGEYHNRDYVIRNDGDLVSVQQLEDWVEWRYDTERGRLYHPRYQDVSYDNLITLGEWMTRLPGLVDEYERGSFNGYTLRLALRRNHSNISGAEHPLGYLAYAMTQQYEAEKQQAAA